MAYMRLKDNHPMMEKLNRVFDLMADLKLEISVQADEMYVIDKSGEFPTTRLQDLEARAGGRSEITELPPMMEYKLVYEKEEQARNQKSKRRTC